MTADALGDGGGRTIWSPAGLADGSADASGDPLADPSSASEGICKFSFGLAPDFDPDVFVREGGVNSGAAVCGLAGWLVGLGPMGAVVLRGGGLISGPSTSSLFGLGGSGAPKKCCANTDPPSSMGVNILRDLDDMCFGCGGVACPGGRRLWFSGWGEERGCG